MSGGVPAPPGRVRIKGKKGSVFRFFIISVAYTVVWIVITSELGYYSKLYGPQVLLQLNIAYYLPSIPVLIVFNQVEKLLDEQFGTTSSMFMRLMAGLLGCALISAFFPFMPSRLVYLLWVAVALGAMSAIAFSTSYQLVAWFRSADTIALGIGCVGSGPLALLLQLGLHIGSSPKRWQWIALFELAAAAVVAGLLAAVSLFWQYWPILSGRQSSAEGMLPLLGDVDERDDDAESRLLLLTPSHTLAVPDPFDLPWLTTPDMLVPSLQEQLQSGRALRRAASAESDLSFAGWRPQGNSSKRKVHRSHTSNALGAPHAAVDTPKTAAAWRASAQQQMESPMEQTGSLSAPPRVTNSMLDEDADVVEPGQYAAATGGIAATSASSASQQAASSSSPRHAHEQQPASTSKQGQHGGSGSASSSPTRSGSYYSSVAGSSSPHRHAAGDSAAGSPSAPDDACDSVGSFGSQNSQGGGRARQSPGRQRPLQHQQQRSRLARYGQQPAKGSVVQYQQHHAASPQHCQSPFASQPADLHDVGQLHNKPVESLLQENWKVFKQTWTVIVGALVASTLLNCIFPFFTYVPSSGWIGELLPQVLFYTRIFADMVGRLAPRKKALALTRPAMLIVLACGCLGVAVVFFLYLQAPPSMQSDSLSIAIVALLWMGGGYINTNSYILAPSLVEAKHVSKASSLMALAHQLAHILGLMAAVALALLLYGDITGDL